MKPEIYHNSKEQDLIWLPKHSKVIAEVAEELYKKEMHYDNVIRGKGAPRTHAFANRTKSYHPYVAWSCSKPEPLLNHPRIKEILMPTRTVPSKDQVLEAAASCPQTKEALKILFPQDFKDEFNWDYFKGNPFTHLSINTEDCQITPSKQLEEAYEAKGTPIPGELYPFMSLRIITELFDFLNKNAGE